MGREIERKFIVANDGWRAAVRPGVSIRQGYLSSEPGRTVRVRVAGDEAFLTIKGPATGASRDEFEYAIPPDDGAALLGLCPPTIVEKVRYEVELEGLTWEVDVFGGDNEGLVIAEVELDDEHRAVSLPPWIGAEVTGDHRYANSVLSRRPYRWSKAR